MSAQLCRSRPPEWWDSGDAGNRLATLICGRCTGCPDNDPAPAGVIRRGVAYTDAGRPLPDCPNCGTPAHGFKGGAIRCRVCAVPQVAIPDQNALRRSRVLALSANGWSNLDIAARVGMAPESVSRVLTVARRAAA